MNLYRQTLALLLAPILLTILFGCAVTHPVNAPRTQMTVPQARKSLAESLTHLGTYSAIKSVRKVKFNHHRVTFVADSLENGSPSTTSMTFAGMENLSLMNFPPANITYVQSNGKSVYCFETKQSAKMFVDAVLTLKEAALAPDTAEEADFAAFTASAKTWLTATPKPEMSEAARTQKVLAEDAFKRKDFPAALDAYCNALDKYPMWPKGQYNAAVLAAETEDYELAAQHMRRYLVLSPDAKDAQAAKDKLLLWQHKAKE